MIERVIRRGRERGGITLRALGQRALLVVQATAVAMLLVLAIKSVSIGGWDPLADLIVSLEQRWERTVGLDKRDSGSRHQ